MLSLWNPQVSVGRLFFKPPGVHTGSSSKQKENPMKNTPRTSLENLSIEAVANIAISIARKDGAEVAFAWLSANFTPEEIKEVWYEINARTRARRG